jgi:L-amino acid N-acyltransferase YncA
MLIRAAKPEDAAAIAAIYAPLVQGTSISFELQPPTVDEMQARISKTLQRLPWLVSTNPQGELTGYVYASPHRERAAYQWAVDVSAYVHSSARGTGVGKRLYQVLCAELAALGYHQAFAGIALPNAASVALYEALGFVHLGTYQNVGYKMGAWHAVGWWQKALQPGLAAAVPPEPLKVFQGLVGEH